MSNFVRGHAQEPSAATLVDVVGAFARPIAPPAPVPKRSDSEATEVGADAHSAVSEPISPSHSQFKNKFTASPGPASLCLGSQDIKKQERDPRDVCRPRACIPPADTPNRPRTLILCFDGTGDQFDADNSNIVQLVSALKKDDKTKQMVYYQTGIGTYTSHKFATPFMTKLYLTLDAMIASNLDSHVMAGYEFLMQNYIANDRVCIFGFSRGAYIARSLAGMIHKVGLLPVDNHQQVPFAYRMYMREDKTGWDQSNAFKKAFSNDVHIDFIGVWDTVDSVGLIPKRLPFTTSNTIVRTFRHAVSLDEHRAKFKANLWNKPNKTERKLGTHAGDMTPPLTPTSPRAGMNASPKSTLFSEKTDGTLVEEKDGAKRKSKKQRDKTWHIEDEKTHQHHRRLDKKSHEDQHHDEKTHDHEHEFMLPGLTRRHSLTLPTLPDLGVHLRSSTDPEENVQQAKFENAFDQQHTKTRQTDVLEVWFAGCHCDVGGGSVPNNTPNSLARIPLRWMIRECFKADTGILFDAARLQELGLDPVSLYPIVQQRPPALALPASARIECIPKPKKGKGLLKRAFSGFRSSETQDVLPMSPELEVEADTMPVDMPAGMEEEEDLKDALSPMYDQLKLKPFWWILEVIPFSFRYQRRDDQWVTEVRANFGNARHIPHQHPAEADPEQHPAQYSGDNRPSSNFKVHRTVRTRLLAQDAKGRPYVNRARFYREPEWVD